MEAGLDDRPNATLMENFGDVFREGFDYGCVVREPKKCGFPFLAAALCRFLEIGEVIFPQKAGSENAHMMRLIYEITEPKCGPPFSDIYLNDKPRPT